MDYRRCPLRSLKKKKEKKEKKRTSRWLEVSNDVFPGGIDAAMVDTDGQVARQSMALILLEQAAYRV